MNYFLTTFSNYSTIFFGWIIGQIIFTVISSYLLQRNLSTINFKQAIVIFIRREIGNYAIAVCALIAALFVLADYTTSTPSREELLLKQVLTFKEKIIVYGRTASIGFGIFCQFILLLVFKSGIKGIKDYAKSKEIEDPTEKPQDVKITL